MQSTSALSIGLSWWCATLLSLVSAACVNNQLSSRRSVPISQTGRMQSAAPGASASEHRVALVIGNTSYKLGALKNPANDARGMQEKLQDLGFEVSLVLDATRDEMKRAVKDFRERLKATGGLGLFYFSGHGVQVDNKNYLVPVDAELADADDIDYQTLSADQVLASMKAARPGLNIMLLDACRNNPFRSTSRGLGRGLALMNAPAGTLLAYSTAPGETASDGDGEYGVWTGALLKHITSEGLIVEQVLKQTAGDVLDQTENIQEPWLATNWRGDVYLNPKKQANAQELLKLAHTNANAGDFLSAISDVGQALQSSVAPLSEHQRDAATRLRDDAISHLAHLRLVVHPPSASLRVDGSVRYSSDGLMELNPGSHRIEVSEEGFRAITSKMELAPGAHEELVLNLEPTERRRRAWVPWTLGGVAIAAFASSTATWWRSSKRQDQLEARCGSDGECPDTFDWEAEQEKGRRLALAGDVTFGIGLAAASSALLVHYWPQLFRPKRDAESAVRLSFNCFYDRCSGAGSFRF